MIFCTQCGQQSKPEAAFCGECGAPIDEPVTAAEFASVDNTTQTAAYNPSKTKGIVAVLAMFLIATMMLGWIVVGFDLHQSIIDEGLPITARFFGMPFEWERAPGMNVRMNMSLDTFAYREWVDRRIDQGWFQDEDMSVARGFSNILLGARIGTTLSVLGIALFLYRTFTGHKKTAVIGKTAATLAALSALVFVGFLHINGSGNGDGFLFNRFPSAWAYLTLILGIVIFVIITKHKTAFDS